MVPLHHGTMVRWLHGIMVPLHHGNQVRAVSRGPYKSGKQVRGIVPTHPYKSGNQVCGIGNTKVESRCAASVQHDCPVDPYKSGNQVRGIGNTKVESTCAASPPAPSVQKWKPGQKWIPGAVTLNQPSDGGF